MTTCVQHQRVRPSRQFFEEQTDISFVEKNYRDALNQLEREGINRARSKQSQRRLGTDPAHVFVKLLEGDHHGN